MINRRQHLAALLGALVAPRIAAAQDKRRPRLAFFAPVIPETEISETGYPNYRIIFKELRRHGYEEGRTIDIERWSARGDATRYPELAREIVRNQPDIIYTVDSGQVRALLAFTTTIPIIVQNVNLVDTGLVESFSRPGRNITGVTPAFSEIQFVMRRHQLLREAIPGLSRMAVLLRRAHWDTGRAHEFRDAAARMGITWVGALLDDPIQPAEYRRVFAAMPDHRIEAVFVPDTTYNDVHLHLIIDLAAESRLPAFTGSRDATERGGLMSYGADAADWFHMMADIIVRMLRGEKPADMPLRSFDKFELAINLKTARALGIEISPSLLARADVVIE